MLLAILGAGGHGRVVAESAASVGWSAVFFDDVRTGQVDGREVAGKLEELSTGRFDGAIVAFGNNRVRLEWLKRLQEIEIPLVSIIDPSGLVSPSASVGAGSFVARGAIVGTGAYLGRGCIVNTAASVEHDCNLADAVHLSPGVRLSGGVTIGEASWLGTGSSVRNHISIGSDVVVGVGSAVVQDIADGLVVAGVPARPLEKS